MSESRSLTIKGYQGRLVDNLFWEKKNPGNWLSIILPGLNYNNDMPLLFFPRELLHWRDVDVLNLNPRTGSKEYQAASEEGQFAWLKADVTAGINAGMAQKEYQGLILVGKSIGSLAIATIGTTSEKTIQTAWVWITPLLRWDVVRNTALSVTGLQAFLCGSADSTFNHERMDEILEKRPLASAYIADKANHSLEVPGDDQKTFTGFSGAMIFLGKFLDKVISSGGITNPS